MFSKIPLLIITFFLFFIPMSGNAQDSNFIKDSIALETAYNNTQAKRKRGEAVQEEWIKVYQKADSLEKVYPGQTYFSYRKAVTLYGLAITNIYGSDLPGALEQLAESIEIKKRIGKYHTASRDYYLMGIVWTRLKEFDKCKVAYDSSYAINQRNLNRGESQLKHKATLLNIYGCHYANIDSLDLAERYFKKAIKFADSLNFQERVATNSIQYAEVIFDQGRYEEALALRKNAQAIYKATNDTLGQYEMKFNLAESYYELGRYKEAIRLLEESVQWHKKLNQKGEMLLEYTLYANALAKDNRFKEAFEVQKELQTLVDSLRNASEYKKIADIEANFKYESTKKMDSLRIVRERQVMEAENIQKSKTRFWIVVASLLLIIGIVTFIYLRNKQRVKEQAYQNIILSNKVATKTEEVNELLTETIQHIKSKERIAENLQKLATEKDGITLKSIIADLKASKADNAKLILIKQNIEQVNFEFIKKLKSLHPNLTKTDIEICSFIRIGLSRKEVANLRNTSLEAVKSSRFRLKKKLQLTANQDLDEYVKTL